MRRGQVWWATLPRPIGRRPVVLLSRDSAYPVRSYVTVAPAFSRVRHLPVEVALGPEDGLPRSCVVNLDSIATIPKYTLQGHITDLSADKLRAVEAAIHFALGLET